MSTGPKVPFFFLKEIEQDLEMLKNLQKIIYLKTTFWMFFLLEILRSGEQSFWDKLLIDAHF